MFTVEVTSVNLVVSEREPEAGDRLPGLTTGFGVSCATPRGASRISKTAKHLSLARGRSILLTAFRNLFICHQDFLRFFLRWNRELAAEDVSLKKGIVEFSEWIVFPAQLDEVG